MIAVSQVSDLQYEDQEFTRIYIVARDRGEFVKDNDNPLFYIPFASKGDKDFARAAFGSKC